MVTRSLIVSRGVLETLLVELEPALLEADPNSIAEATEILNTLDSFSEAEQRMECGRPLS